MSNRFQDITDVGIDPPSVNNRFINTAIQHATNRFNSVIEQQDPNKEIKGTIQATGDIMMAGLKMGTRAVEGVGSAIGGGIGAIGRILSVPQQATTGVLESSLEGAGILKSQGKGLGIVEGIKNEKSNIDLLHRIGQETGKGGLLTGQYEVDPRGATGWNSAVFSNWAKEIPSTAIGLTGDIFLDPTILLSKLKVVPKTIEATAKAISKGVESVSSQMPIIKSAVQGVGELLGRAFITRFGQRPEFAASDIDRKIQESLLAEDVGTFISDTIERPSAIQQRIAQVIKGGITTKDEIKQLAAPIREELDRVGESISSLNPALLNPKTYDANRGTYFPRLYTKHEFPTNEEELMKSLFPHSEMALPKDRFKKRLTDLSFAKSIDPEIVDVSKEINKIEDRFNKMTYLRREKVVLNNQDISQSIDDIHKAFSGEVTGEISLLLKDKGVDISQRSLKSIVSTVHDRVQLKPLNIEAMQKTNEARKILQKTEGMSEEALAKLKEALKNEQDNLPDEVSIVQDIIKNAKANKAKSIGISSKTGSEDAKFLLEQAKILKKRFVQDSLSPDVTKKFIEDVANEFEKNPVAVSALLNRISSRGDRVGKLLDEIISIKKDRLNSLRELPTSLNEIKRLAEQARSELGLITEAGYPAAKALLELKTVERRQLFFKSISRMASDEPRPGWIQLSDDKGLGDLVGKFLPAAEYRAISALRRTPTELEKIYEKGLALWKTSKTAYNPATIVRNDITNFMVLNPLGGVGFHRLDIYAGAINDIMTKSHLYNLARLSGLNISVQSASELKSEATIIYKENEPLFKQFFNKVSDFHNAVVNFYGSQDKLFKMANFRKGILEDKLTPQQAMNRANFHLVDYSEVPELVDWLRKSPIGIPFISFTYGVSKPLAKTLIENPEKLSAYYKALSAIQNMDPYGENNDQIKQEMGVLPEWIQTGTYLRLPWRDQYGRGQYIDLQYILPTNVLEGSSLTPSSPVLKLIADVAIHNRNSFTDKPISLPSDAPVEALQKKSLYVYQQIMPSMAPFGYSFEKIKAWLEHRPDSKGYVRNAVQVFMDVLGGIKITPIDPTVEAQIRAGEKRKEIIDLQTQLRKTILDKTLLPKERIRQSQNIESKLQSVYGQ